MLTKSATLVKKKNLKINFDRTMLLKLFLALLLICVYIVATKLASNTNTSEPVLASNANTSEMAKPEKQAYVAEVVNDTTAGRKYAVKVHQIDVQEYDYWFHTNEEYNVGDKIIDE